MHISKDRTSKGGIMDNEQTTICGKASESKLG